MPTHVYKLKSGKRVPSVTTILNRWKESGGLITWNYNKGYEDGEAGLIPDPHGRKEDAGDVGTYTHALIKWHLEGELDDEPPPDDNFTKILIKQGRVAYEQFLRWEQLSGYRILSWEMPLVSEVYEFGGTPDAIFTWTWKETLANMGDWKTGKRVYQDAFLQCCAYLILYNENFPEAPCNGAIDIVRFSKEAEINDHKTIVDKALIEEGKEQFLDLLRCYKRDKLIAAHF